jgi:hypothetical protein
MEVVMEDQMLHVDREQETISDEDLARKLLKKEQRLLTRLQEAQEAEARAQDRFQRAEVRLQRRRARLERIKSNLMLVQKQIADAQITDQQPAQMESALVMPATLESTPRVDAEEVAPVQVEQDIVVAQESEVSSPSFVENASSKSVEPEAVTTSEDTRNASTTLEAEVLSSSQTETTPISVGLNQVLAASGGEQGEIERDSLSHPPDAQPLTRQGTSSPAPLMSAPMEATLESEGSSSSSIEPTTSTTIEQEPVASADSTAVEPEVDATPEVDTASDSSTEREPTKPLRLEQEDQPAAGSLSPDIQSAKEAWVAAESAMQHARNTAHGIAASISFLSQTSEFSNEFMAELVYKQSDANKALVKAQNAAREAYERYVQAQEEAKRAASQSVDVSMGTSGDHAQQNQENGTSPAEVDNAADQTVEMHAIRLYKEW